MKTYRVVIDGLMFIVELTEDECQALTKDDDGIIIIPA